MSCVRERLFRLTPLGRADQELKKHFEDTKIKSLEAYDEYEESRKKYRNRKVVQMGIKVLLYAGVITSIAASFNVPYIRVINHVASYIGVSMLLVLYTSTFYISSLFKEEYHLKREILISEATER